MKTKTKFKQTEIGMIPEDWKIARLGDCCKLVKKQFKPSEGDKRKYIGLEHIEQQSLRLTGIGSSENIESNKFEFNQGQILFGKLRPYFRKVYRPKFDGVCSTDIWVIDTQGFNDQSFFFYFFANERIITEANNSSEGTRMPRARWDYLEKLEFPIPSLPEQQSIAKILSDLDSKIELNQQMNKTLEEIGKAIFKHWFVDFEFPNEEGKPYKSSGGEMVYNEELGKDLPKGWEIQTLEKLGDLKNGINYSRNENGDTTFSIINVRDLVSNNFILESTLDKINIDSAKSRDYLLIKGDIIIARSASPGETIFIADNIDNLIYSGFSIRFRPNNPTYGIYLFNNLQNLKDNLNNLSDGTTLKNINQEILKKIQIIIPKEEILIRYNSILENLYKKIILLLKENKSLMETRDLLLPKLMSGKIRVPVEAS